MSYADNGQRLGAILAPPPPRPPTLEKGTRIADRNASSAFAAGCRVGLGELPTLGVTTFAAEGLSPYPPLVTGVLHCTIRFPSGGAALAFVHPAAGTPPHAGTPDGGGSGNT
eukprot:scaffold21070_cov107-Isochrysis_galbana.AAC.3